MDTSITATDIEAFKICDGVPGECASCGPSSRLRAPVIIKGRTYCLWCAFEMARERMK